MTVSLKQNQSAQFHSAQQSSFKLVILKEILVKRTLSIYNTHLQPQVKMLLQYVSCCKVTLREMGAIVNSVTKWLRLQIQIFSHGYNLLPIRYYNLLWKKFWKGNQLWKTPSDSLHTKCKMWPKSYYRTWSHFWF